jgi:hypothetical protein
MRMRERMAIWCRLRDEWIELNRLAKYFAALGAEEHARVYAAQATDAWFRWSDSQGRI